MGKPLGIDPLRGVAGLRFIPVTPSALVGLLRQKPSTSKLWYVLALHADLRTGESWPSYKTISEATGLSKTSISNAAKELTRLGLLEKRRRHNDSNMYTVKGLSLIGSGSKIVPLQSSNRTNVVLEVDIGSPSPETLTTYSTHPLTPASLRDVAFKHAGKLAFEGRIGDGQFSQDALEGVLGCLSSIKEFEKLNLSGRSRIDAIEAKLREAEVSFGMRIESTGRSLQHWFEGCFRRWLAPGGGQRNSSEGDFS